MSLPLSQCPSLNAFLFILLSVNVTPSDCLPAPPRHHICLSPCLSLPLSLCLSPASDFLSASVSCSLFSNRQRPHWLLWAVPHPFSLCSPPLGTITLGRKGNFQCLRQTHKQHMGTRWQQISQETKQGPRSGQTSQSSKTQSPTLPNPIREPTGLL